MVILLVLAMGVLATACAKTVTEKVIENQTGGKVKIKSGKGSVEIKGKGGTFSVGENKLPKDFPEDIPIYKPSKVMGSMSNTLEGKKTFVVTLSTKDALDEVNDFYKNGLVKEGWTEKSALSGGDGSSKFASLGYEKGGNLVTITISRVNDDKETQVAISHSPKQ